MASWMDVFSLITTTLFFFGSIACIIYVARKLSSYFQSTKESLEHRGVTLSRDGISLKTERRFDRDAYLDATQRGLVKAFGAATVGPQPRQHTHLSQARSESHSSSSSNSSLVDASSEKHMSWLGLRRSRSGGHEEGH